MTEQEFRADKVAVEGLNIFLTSESGLKFLKVLEGESIINKLSSPENQTVRGVRDLAAVETGSADNLLGRCIGYNIVSQMVQRLRTLIVAETQHPASRASRVAKTMRLQENQSE